VKGLRIGLPREYFIEGSIGREEALDDAIAVYTALGAEFRSSASPYRLRGGQLLPDSHRRGELQPGPLDGVRFGHRAAGAKGLQEMFARTRDEGSVRR